MNKAIERSAFCFLLFLPVIPWISYLSLLFLIYFYFRERTHGFTSTLRIPLNYYAYGLLIAVLLSSILSTHKLLSFGAFAIFLCYILSYLIFGSFNLPRTQLVTAIILSGILLTGIGIVLYFTKWAFIFEHGIFRIRLSPEASTLGNANRFAKYLVLITPIAFSAILFTRPLKILALIFIPMAFFSLWRTQSLAGIVATFIALLIVLCGKNKLIAFIALICGIGLYGVNHNRAKLLTDSRSIEVRINTLKYIVPQIFKFRPVTGCGLGTYKKVATKYDKENRGLHYHSHNMYTHYLCETGVLGLSAFLLFLGMLFRYSIRFVTTAQSSIPNPIVLGGIASITGLLIHGMVETCIDYIPIGIFFFTLIGIVTSEIWRHRDLNPGLMAENHTS